MRTFSDDTIGISIIIILSIIPDLFWGFKYGFIETKHETTENPVSSNPFLSVNIISGSSSTSSILGNSDLFIEDALTLPFPFSGTLLIRTSSYTDRS